MVFMFTFLKGEVRGGSSSLSFDWKFTKDESNLPSVFSAQVCSCWIIKWLIDFLECQLVLHLLMFCFSEHQ